MKLSALFILAIIIGSVAADQYAVLVAGSNTFANYRHQADICHAYQVLIKHGVNPNNIIVMAYDDIANNSENPFKGQIFNKPTNANPGVDVYSGCKIDYTGASVTPENYLKILKGQTTTGGDGRTLKSGANDTVFLNFSDHGAAGLIAFPSEYLYATDLIAALNQMTDNKEYSQMVYYLESCESGSMFTSLAKNTKIYALSAAGPDESSWGTYCPPDDIVSNKHIGSCLGDLFSVNWMEDDDSSDVTTETLQEQFTTVYTETKDYSSVMQWGDQSFTSEVVGTFVGMTKQASFKRMIDFFGGMKQTQHTSVDQRDAQLQYLMKKYQQDPTLETISALEEEIAKSKKFNQVFDAVKSNFGLTGVISTQTNWECYKNAVNSLESKFGKANDYALKNFRYLFEYCSNSNSIAGLESVFSQF
eukprot:TRINITY_DN145_c0_g1_i3.p1 TRINITY_DN145_c0_g1~~TRINITY_DN145_c0_g1_i3.p1  ORF type:complete len:418 (-),score=86.40 TRINITY_DN145_c0_g1_i3:270-1523(-)